MGEAVGNQKAEVATMLRSVIQSSKGGVLVTNLQREYKLLVGDGIPFRKMGYQTLEAFLKDMPDIVKITRNSSGEQVVQAVADPATAHIASLVARQKTTKTNNTAKTKTVEQRIKNLQNEQNKFREEFKHQQKIIENLQKICGSMAQRLTKIENNPPMEDIQSSTLNAALTKIRNLEEEVIWLRARNSELEASAARMQFEKILPFFANRSSDITSVSSQKNCGKRKKSKPKKTKQTSIAKSHLEIEVAEQHNEQNKKDMEKINEAEIKNEKEKEILKIFLERNHTAFMKKTEGANQIE